VPNWDEDSPQLRQNLTQVLSEIVRAAQRREYPTLVSARRWQSLAMKDLTVPDPRFVGAFRGEPGLEQVQVRVGAQYGVDAAEVAVALEHFETKLHALVAELDLMLPAGQEADADQLAAIVDLCAWVHAEWVRIHPFANDVGKQHCPALRRAAIYSTASQAQLRLRGDRRQGDGRRLEANRRRLSAIAR
jgi:hypothetical protein